MIHSLEAEFCVKGNLAELFGFISQETEMGDFKETVSTVRNVSQCSGM